MPFETPRGGRIPLRLELDPGSEPISGRVVGPDGAIEEFNGWLALAALIERRAQEPVFSTHETSAPGVDAGGQ